MLLLSTILVTGTLYLFTTMVVSGHLLVAKEYEQEHVITKVPLKVTYHLYNQGDDSVLNVEIADESFSDSAQFKFMDSSSLPFKVPEIAPNSHHQVNLKLMPMVVGSFADQPAIITYQRPQKRSDNMTSAELETVRSRSTATGLRSIISRLEYNTFVKSHRKEWWIFMVVTGLIIVLPYYRYKQAMNHLK